MTPKQKRLAYVAGSFGFLIFVGVNLIASSPTPTVVTPTTGTTPAFEEAPMPTPLATPTSEVGVSSSDRGVDYAIAVPELSGLPPDAEPGAMLDLWVTWNPPITKAPQVQPLLRSVRLARIVPPVTPEGPAVALLTIRPSQISDLIYGDRFGSLSVTILATT